MDKTAFDNRKYLSAQKDAIFSRVKEFDKLYLEMGGHLLYDGHASRVLPGYDPKNKVSLLKELNHKAVLIYCVSAKEIEKNFTWTDSGLNLEDYSINEVRALRKEGINVFAFAINRFEGEEKAKKFIQRLKKEGEKVVVTTEIKGYPKNMKNIFGKKGFEAQPLLKIDSSLIIVTGAGANNGKMFFALSQIYQWTKRGIEAGFAKFETFPIHDLELNHEINLAYEAATADIGDKIMIDPYHKKYYRKNEVNYNRDVENFAILKKMINKICAKDNSMYEYHSPTDMGINRAKKGIIDDKLIRVAAREEIFSRQKHYAEKYAGGKIGEVILRRMKRIIKKLEAK